MSAVKATTSTPVFSPVSPPRDGCKESRPPGRGRTRRFWPSRSRLGWVHGGSPLRDSSPPAACRIHKTVGYGKSPLRPPEREKRRRTAVLTFRQSLSIPKDCYDADALRARRWRSGPTSGCGNARTAPVIYGDRLPRCLRRFYPLGERPWQPRRVPLARAAAQLAAHQGHARRAASRSWPSSLAPNVPALPCRSKEGPGPASYLFRTWFTLIVPRSQVESARFVRAGLVACRRPEVTRERNWRSFLRGRR